MEFSLAIIGTAGRKEDADKLTLKHFEAMCIVATGLIEQINENGNGNVTHLVSGGAAWADHVAVKLFLDKKAPNLRLYIPCKFVTGSFLDLGVNDWKSNPGGTANHFHKKFQNKARINSLSQLQIAKDKGAEFIECKGFHARNAMVAKSDMLLAMTFGEKNMVKDGGTAHTVETYLNRIKKDFGFDKSFHYDLTSGEVFVGCTVPKKVSLLTGSTAHKSSPRLN